MNVISIGTDRKIFEEGSAVRIRMVEYCSLVDELHIIVFSEKKSTLQPIQIAANGWVYPTNSLSRVLYPRDAEKLAAKVIARPHLSTTNTIISCQDPFETGLVGMRIKRRYGFKLQLQIHTDFLSPHFSHTVLNLIRKRIARSTLRYADEIRVVSERIRLSLLKKYSFLTPSAIDVLPIFTSLEQPKTSGFNVKDAYPQFSHIILMASRITKEKNYIFALKVMRQVMAAFPKAGLLIVGQGPEERTVHQKVKEFGMIDTIVFQPWQKELYSYYSTADLFLLTSLYEGYGLTLVEAALAGAPIITSDVGIAGNILIDKKNAAVCPVNDETCFVESIKELLLDTTLRQKYAAAAKEDVKSALIQSKSEYLQHYLVLFKKTLQANSQKARLSKDML